MVEKIDNKETLSPDEFAKKVANLISELKTRLFDITKENFKNPNCIDWRDLNNARPSIPGGGLWALWVILASVDTDATEAEIKDICKYVKEYFGWELTGHTDDHQNDPSHQCQGCGHVERLVKQWERYKLSAEKSAIIEAESNKVAAHSLDTLEWSHKERNVFIVDIPNKWIQANTGSVQDFVYNVWYARDLYSEIITLLNEKMSLDLELEGVMEVAQDHFMQTGGDLAQWKDVFAIINVDNDNTKELDHLMVIPFKEAA
jgi:hypothetical protein